MAKSHSLLMASLILVITTACASSGSQAPQVQEEVVKPSEPMTLTMLQDGATISDEEFETMIAAPVKAKYPHITVQIVRNTKGADGLSNLISGGSFPDFMFTTYPQIKIHRELGTAYDMTSLIKTYKMDIGKFDPAAMETSRVYGGNEGMYAVPFSLNFLALFYNKDIFDMFGVTYPKEGMTWDETVNLAKNFSRTAGGVEYKGIMIPGIGDLITQLSLPYVNATTNKAAINSDGWNKVFQLIKAVNEIPGNKGATLDHFLKTQTLAMIPTYDARFAALEKLQGTPSQFNWDITQFPSYTERPNTSLASSGHFLLVSALSKHKEEAFEVINLLTSEANQNLITEHGRFTSLNNEQIKNKYGMNMKSMQGKNIKAVFNSKFAPPFPPTKYDKFATPHLTAAVKSVIDGELDVNSAIRRAEEAFNKDIEANK
ncbi:ABC transporter substrate-binding protein [Paenibacillus hodogayensis]|uniref:ABC transporter substrate-binding protein n=1 Tax=Paenibacillus hodogayensis TaxID=279208 RepID=A0ABV5W4W9_9BACL